MSLFAFNCVCSEFDINFLFIFWFFFLKDMDLAFVPPLYPPIGNRAIYEVKPFSSALHRNLHSQRTSPCLATAATQTSQVFLLNPLELIFQLFIYFCKKLHFSILSFSFIFNVPQTINLLNWHPNLTELYQCTLYHVNLC